VCGLCGLFGSDHGAEPAAQGGAFPGPARRTQRAERLRRAAVVNAALAPARMRVADFQASRYVVSGATGGSAVVDDLGGVWAAVDRLRGRALDPLDPDWIAALGSAP
jgi:hypothetical protein